MKTAIIILLSLVSLNSFAQNEDVDSYNPCVTYIAKVNGLTNCHINQELFGNYDMELPLGVEGLLGVELYQRNGFLLFEFGVGRSCLNYHSDSGAYWNNIINNYLINIGYQYLINDRLSVGGCAGLNVAYRVMSRRTLNGKEELKYKGGFDAYIIDLGLEVEYKLNKMLAMHIEPYLNYPISYDCSIDFREDYVFSPIIGIKLGGTVLYFV